MKHNIVCGHNNEVLECQTLAAFDYIHKKTVKHFSDAKQCRLVVR